MNKIVSFFQRIQKIVAVFLVSSLLMLTTACNGSASAIAPDASAGGRTPDDVLRGRPSSVLEGKSSDQIRPDMPSGRVNSSYEGGGMNKYPDTDPRRNAAPAGAKAQNLIENAERQVIDQTGDVGENTKRILDKKGENVKDYAGNAKKDLQSAGAKAKSSATEFTEGAKQGAENLKENVEDAGENVAKGAKRTAEDTTDTVKYNTREATKSTQRALEDAKNALD